MLDRPGVGEQLRFVGSGQDIPPFVGRYTEIVAPTKLVFEALGAVGTVFIKPWDEGSRFDVEIRAQDSDALKYLLAVAAAVGTSGTLDNLEAYSRS